MAEAGQIASSSANDIIQVSYHQQQPPLSYYFSSFSDQLWKNKKFAMRFHAMSFHLLLSFILPLALYSFFPTLRITLFGSLFFFLNHTIRLHAVDGRPLNLALLTGLLFVFFYLSSFNKRPKFLILTASQYLFVVSIGLQPVILVFSLFLSSFMKLFSGQKKIFKTLLLSHIVTALLVLPYYTYMYLFANSAHKYHTPSFNRLEAYMQGFGLREFLERYLFPFYSEMTLFVLLLLFVWSIVIIVQKKISQQTLIAALTTLGFILFFDAIFRFFINWSLENWYFIVWSLPLIVFITSIFNDTVSFFLKRKEKLFVLLPLLSVFLWNACNQIILFQKEERFAYPYHDNDIERVYHYLKENGHPTDIVLQLSLVPIPISRESHLYNFKKFFFQLGLHPLPLKHSIRVAEAPPFFNEDMDDMIYYLNWNDIPTKQDQKIFIVSANNGFPENRTQAILSQLTKEHRIGNFSIFTFFLNKEDRERQYKDLLHRFLEKTPPKHSTALYETLLYYACRNGDDKKHGELLKQYEALEPLLDEFTGYLKFPSRFALRRRVKIFKKKQYCH